MSSHLEPFFPKFPSQIFVDLLPKSLFLLLSQVAQEAKIQIPKSRHREVIGLSSGGVMDSLSSPATAAAAWDRPRRAPLPLPSVRASPRVGRRRRSILTVSPASSSSPGLTSTSRASSVAVLVVGVIHHRCSDNPFPLSIFFKLSSCPSDFLS
ncbi:hypothetical protein AAHA92_33973 [Salvia divinorum]|uniref:Uncharacterized protein n=1 Tax=Salvia divinorum TaxID=28513 RepID=A0ABD1FIE6_SALDI